MVFQSAPIVVGAIVLIVVLLGVAVAAAIYLGNGRLQNDGRSETKENREESADDTTSLYGEPDSVFAWSYNGERIAAQLIDHITGETIKEVSIKTSLPVASTSHGALPSSHEVKYNGPNGLIIFRVDNGGGYGGSGDSSLDFCEALYTASFEDPTPQRIWGSGKDCTLVDWQVHPWKPEMYLLTRDVYHRVNLIDLNTKRVVKNVGYSDNFSQLALNYETSELAFADWLGNVHFEGELQSFIEIGIIDIWSDKGKNNIFIRDSFKNFQYVDDATNLSPDFKYLPYGSNEFGYIDLKSGKKYPISAFTGDQIKNYFILWSGDASRMLFTTGSGLNIFDRLDQNKEVIPTSERLINQQWAPSQRYILFISANGSSDDIRVWDTDSKQFIEFVDRDGIENLSGASWAYKTTQ